MKRLNKNIINISNNIINFTKVFSNVTYSKKNGPYLIIYLKFKYILDLFKFLQYVSIKYIINLMGKSIAKKMKKIKNFNGIHNINHLKVKDKKEKKVHSLLKKKLILSFIFKYKSKI